MTNSHKCPVKVVAKGDFALEPYKYYVHKGESIIDLGRNFIHLDKNGRTIYKTRRVSPCLKLTDQGIRSYDVPESNLSFAATFDKMVRLNKPDIKEGFLISELENDSPVIIGGCGRSGTTLLTSMLGAHPNLSCIKGETFAFYPSPLRLRGLVAEKPKGRWVEKTPKNVCVFNQIIEIIPKAKLIHVVRDGRAVITSHHPNHKEKYWVDMHRWFDDVSCGLLSPAHLVKYEDLVLCPTQTLKKICDFIGEEYSDKMLDFHENSNFKEDPSLGGKIKPLYSDSLYKWENEMSTQRVREFHNSPDCMTLMGILGYKV